MPRSRSFLRTAIIAGLVAGTFDILDPILFFWLRNHIHPERILQSVAAGLLGRAAYTGGLSTAVLGLLLHFCIATAWAALFIFLARYVPVMREHAVPAGMIYGLFVYAMMNFVVLPHTKAAPPSHAPLLVFNAVCAIVFLVGLPIALVNRRLA